ncbi:MAG: glycosyltransferase family 4 protein [Gammaproteobacteria bacterium]
MTRTPRVYWLTDEFYPPEIGGTGVMAANLAQGLAACGLETHVITRQTQPPCLSREAIGEVDVRRIRPAGRLKGAGWRALPAVLYYLVKLIVLLTLEARRFDVLMISGMKIIPLAAVPVCRLLGKKCVIRVESPFEIVEPISAESLGAMRGVLGRLLSRVLRRLQRAVLRRADAVIAISADMVTVLSGCGLPPARIVKITNAIDLVRFQPLPAEERAQLRLSLGIPPQATMVLYTGRLSRAKGVGMLIDVWRGLVATRPNLLLVLVGSGRGSWDDCEDEIVAAVRTHAIEKHVLLAGQSDRVQDYVQAADLFVSPSDYEGFGLALVEALAGGVPAVTTSVGVAPEILRHGVNGFLCPPKNPDALTAVLEEALAQRGRWPQIGRLGLEAVQEYDLPRVAARYCALVHELCGQAPPAS